MRSVRNTADRIIQFQYGEDGIDPARGVHGSPFNIDVIVDAALGTSGVFTYVEPESEEGELMVVKSATKKKLMDLGVTRNSRTSSPMIGNGTT